MNELVTSPEVIESWLHFLKAINNLVKEDEDYAEHCAIFGAILYSALMRFDSENGESTFRKYVAMTDEDTRLRLENNTA